MTFRQFLFLYAFWLSITSCTCKPEQIAHYAFIGMEMIMGEGFVPSEDIRALGDFQDMNVELRQSSETGSSIVLKLANGDPRLLGTQREILARKCAELYLNGFKNGSGYDTIQVQFIQTDPHNPENVAIEAYEFEVKDFGLQDS